MDYIGIELLRDVEDDLIAAENLHRVRFREAEEAAHRLAEATSHLEWTRSQYFAARDSVNERLAAV